MVDEPLCFATDRSLGKLARWLRLFGFDTLFEPVAPIDPYFWQNIDSHRKCLIRSRQLMHTMTELNPLLIISNDPFEQLYEVIRFFELKAVDLRPFSRCTLCNILLITIEKSKIRGMVPDYIWQTQSEFRKCAGCGRIYWPGSHKDRSMIRLEQFFFKR
jgi:uncharacterized protein